MLTWAYLAGSRRIARGVLDPGPSVCTLDTRESRVRCHSSELRMLGLPRWSSAARERLCIRLRGAATLLGILRRGRGALYDDLHV